MDDYDRIRFNYETESIEEIINICGTKLLLDKMTLCDTCYTKYIIGLKRKGDFYDNKLWKNVNALIIYGENQFDISADRVGVTIYFGEQGEIPFPSLYLENSLPYVVNGTIVNYSEWTNEQLVVNGRYLPHEFEYGMFATYFYNQNTYYVSAMSKNNPKLLWSTINQMLDK